MLLVLLAMGRIKPVLKIRRSGAMMDREILNQNYGLLALKTIEHSK